MLNEITRITGKQAGMDGDKIVVLDNGAWVEVSSDVLTQAQSAYDERIASEKVEADRSEALAYLSSTDWYVVRYADTGEPIPTEVKTKRAEARLKI